MLRRRSGCLLGHWAWGLYSLRDSQVQSLYKIFPDFQMPDLPLPDHSLECLTQQVTVSLLVFILQVTACASSLARTLMQPGFSLSFPHLPSLYL